MKAECKTDHALWISELFQNNKVHRIFGPAGTGKTTHLITELKNLFGQGVKPDKIAFVSFTNRAVNELVERCTKEFPVIDKNGFKYFRTIHSLCYNSAGGKKVIQHPELVALARKNGLEMSSYRSIEDGAGAKKGDKVISIDSLSRLRLVTLEEQWRESNLQELPYHIVENWQMNYYKYKQSKNLIDFTDMLLMFDTALDVDYVFIDECQDLSPLQWEIMDKASQNCKTVYIAGDDDQSIYSWAGAEVEYILNIRANKDIVLPKSYRLPKEIYNVSSKILKRIKNRKSKKYTHNGKEGKVDVVFNFKVVDYKKEDDCLILVRNRWQIKEIKTYLETIGVPYFLFGQNSLETPEVESMLLWEHFRKGKELTPAQFKKMAKFSKKLRKLISSSQVPKELLEVPWFNVLDLIPLEKKNFIRRVLQNKLFGIPKIRLSTIHQSKGGEAETVVLLTDVSRMVWENIYSDDEHRVWYVAVTRAKNKLVIVQAQSNKFYKI